MASDPASLRIATRGARAALVCAILAFPSGRGAAGFEAGLGDFLEERVPALMEAHRVPGVAFVAVEADGVLLQRGWGYADIEAERPIDPETTLFRVASLTKLFTTTAALQRVEAGDLELDADVQDVLRGVRLEGEGREPITLRHLLTHTGGFDDRMLQGTEALEAEPWALEPYLAERMPPRIREPGRILSYSNHGFALAGLLVEQASGRPFAEAVREGILEPLGMTHSQMGIGHEPPAALAVPYATLGDRPVPIPLTRSRRPPSASLLTSAGDMARFLRAQLNGGTLDGERILSPGSVRAMHARAFSQDPRIDGWCLGFVEGRRNGWRTIGHGGSLPGFRTRTVLVPEAGKAWFVATNAESGGALIETLNRALLDRFFPAREPAPVARPAPAPELAGRYVPDRHIRSTFLKLSLLRLEEKVEPSDRGFVLHRPGHSPETFEALGDGLFRGVDGQVLATYATDERGRVSRLFLGGRVLNRLPGYRGAAFQQVLLFGGVFFFAGVAIRSGVGLARQGWDGPRGLLLAVSVLHVAFGAGFFGTLLQTERWILERGEPTALVGWLVLPLLALAASLGLPWAAGRVRGAQRRGVLVFTVVSLGYLTLLGSWNLIGFHY